MCWDSIEQCVLVLDGNQCLRRKINDFDNMNDVKIQRKLKMQTYFLAQF